MISVLSSQRCLQGVPKNFLSFWTLFFRRHVIDGYIRKCALLRTEAFTSRRLGAQYASSHVVESGSTSIPRWQQMNLIRISLLHLRKSKLQRFCLGASDKVRSLSKCRRKLKERGAYQPLMKSQSASHQVDTARECTHRCSRIESHMVSRSANLISSLKQIAQPPLKQPPSPRQYR